MQLAPTQQPPLNLAAHPAAPFAHVDPSLDALDVLGRAAGVEIDRAGARRAMEQAARAHGADHAIEAFTRAAGALGLRVEILSLSAAEVCSGDAGPRLPAVALPGRGHGGLVARAARGRKVLIEPLSGGGGAWLDAAALTEALGAGAEDHTLWAFAEPLGPMDALAARGPGSSPERRLWALAALERDDIAAAVVCAIGVGVVSLAAPIGVQALVNTVAFGGLAQPVVVLSLLVLAALAFAATLRAVQARVVERIQERIFARAAVDLARRLPRVRASAFDDAYGPELVNRFFDVITVQKGVAALLVDGLSIALQVTAGGILLSFYHPALLAFDLILLTCTAAALWILGRGAAASSIKESKAKYEVAAWLEEIARHPLSFKSAGGSALAEARAEDLCRGYLAARRKHFKALFRQIVGALALQALATAALLGVGGFLVMRGQITLGQLVAAELLVSAMVAGFAKLGKYLESYYDLVAAAEKIGQLVDLPLEAPGGAPLRRREVGARVRVAGARFAHGDRPVLAGVSLTITPGAKVAVIGPNGSGKSTLADLIFGLRAPSAGHVEIDGVDLRDLDRTSLREQIALVRGVSLFDGTVADNVRAGRVWLTDDDVRAALDAVGLREAVAALPGGLEARVTTAGLGLSAGEARRLVLARALAGRPRLLILDESLDDLDPPSRDAVARALFARGAPWSALVTTHDREALRGCDEVLVLDGGALRPLRAGDIEAR